MRDRNEFARRARKLREDRSMRRPARRPTNDRMFAVDYTQNGGRWYRCPDDDCMALEWRIALEGSPTVCRECGADFMLHEGMEPWWPRVERFDSQKFFDDDY